MLVSCEKVQGRKMEDFLSAIISRFGERPKVKSLDLASLKEQLQKAQQGIDNWTAKVDNWKFPVEFDPLRAELFRFSDSWSSACVEARQHVSALQGLLKDARKTKTKKGDVWRKGRNKAKGYFEDWGMPKAVARVCADKLWAVSHPPSEAEIELPNACEDVSLDSLDIEDFMAPFFVGSESDKPVDNQSHLAKQIQTFAEKHHNIMLVRKGEAAKTMSRDKRNVAFGTIDNACEISFGNAEDDLVLTNLVPKCRTLVTVYYHNACNPTIAAQPCR